MYQRFFGTEREEGRGGGIKKEKEKKKDVEMKRRGFVIMACSERSRHSRPYSARNK